MWRLPFHVDPSWTSATTTSATSATTTASAGSRTNQRQGVSLEQDRRQHVRKAKRRALPALLQQLRRQRLKQLQELVSIRKMLTDLAKLEDERLQQRPSHSRSPLARRRKRLVARVVLQIHNAMPM